MLISFRGDDSQATTAALQMSVTSVEQSYLWATARSYRWPVALVAVGSLLAMMTSHTMVIAVMLALCAWALRGPYWALQSLTLATFVKFLNPDLVAFPAGFGALSWILVLVGILRIAPTLRTARFQLLGPIVLFSAFALVTSLVSSRAPIVSIMKALSFAALVSTTLAASSSLPQVQFESLLKWLFTVASTVVFLSMVALLRPAIAYEHHSTLLHGIINQPQSLGVIAAPIAAALLTIYFLERRGLSVPHLAFTIVLWAGMLLTQARTAAIAAIGGALIAALASQGKRRNISNEPHIRRMVIALLLLAITLAAVEVQTGKIAPAVQGFILKRGTSDGVKDAFLESRGLGAMAEFEHFLASPVVGNGFGVYPSGEFPAGVVTVAGIPLSAPVEKGFLPTAVLEETGLLGAALLCWALYAVLHAAWQGASLPLIAAAFTCVLVNIGEATLLSPAGVGYYLWLILGLAVRAGQLAEASAERAPIAGGAGIASASVQPRPLPNLMS